MNDALMHAEILPQGHLVNGRFEIERALGIGGMGAVYLARDTILEGSRVALKVLHSHLINNEDLYRRFLREVKLMHQVNHPNVVRTYDIGNDGTTAYFTMEFVQGAAFEKIIKKGPMPIKEALKIIQQVCDGLQAVHDCNIVHRDLKPANIMVLNDGLVKITDFGVARPETSDLTEHDSLIGTMAYMAPEIMLGKETTSSVDIYSLGVIMYLALTGEVPFRAETPAQLVMMHVKKTPVPPRKLRPEIPNWVNRLILSMLAKTVKERPRDARSISQTIQSNLDNEDSSDAGSREGNVHTPNNRSRSQSVDSQTGVTRQRNTGHGQHINYTASYAPPSPPRRGRSRSFNETTTINGRKLIRQYWPLLILMAGLFIFLGLLSIVWAQELFTWVSFELSKFLNSL